jgi:integrase
LALPIRKVGGEVETALAAFFHNHACNTEATYRKALADLETIRRPWWTCETRDVLRWLTSMRARALSDGTVWTWFCGVRSCFALLKDLELADSNPCAKCRRVLSLRRGEQVRPTKLISFNQIKPILKSALKGAEGARDACFLALAFGCGLRRSELRALNVGSLEYNPEGQLYLELPHVKAGKPQQVAVPPWAVRYVVRLIRERGAAGAVDADPLFVLRAYRGCVQRISDKGVYRLYRRLVGAAPHSARATFASRLKTLGLPYEDVAEALRHSGTGMVRAYDKRVRGISNSPGLKIRY